VHSEGPPEPQGRTAFHVAIVSALALLIFLFRLGAADWRDDYDTHQAQIMQEMMGGHGWVLPLRNGRHLPDKPPLYSWFGAASAWVRQSGVDALDARLPSALLATLCVIGVYGFTRALAGGAVALWAALLLITTPQFVIAARDSHVDMAFCAFLTIGLALGWRVYEGEGGRRTALLVGLCFGLATLSKGPLALVLGALVFGATALLAPPRPGWRALLAPPALLASIGLPALWYLAATAEHGLAFVRLHLLEENVSRFSGGLGRWPLGFYIEPLLTLGLPWTLALPGTLRGESALPARSRRFLWTWVVVMFVLFTVAGGKRRVYLLPIRPALAILLAGWLVPQLSRWRHLRRPATTPRAAYAVIGSLVIAGLACILALRMGLGGFGASPQEWGYWWRLHLQDYMSSAAILIIGMGVGAALIMHGAWQRNFDLAAYSLVGTLALAWTIGVSSDAIVRGEAVSFRDLAQHVAAEVDPTQPLAFLDVDDDPAIDLLYHLRRHIAVVQSVNGDGPCTPPSPGAYLIAESRWDADACASNPRWHAIARGGPEVGSHRSQRLVFARYDASLQPEHVP